MSTTLVFDEKTQEFKKKECYLIVHGVVEGQEKKRLGYVSINLPDYANGIKTFESMTLKHAKDPNSKIDIEIKGTIKPPKGGDDPGQSALNKSRSLAPGEEIKEVSNESDEEEK